MPCSVNERQLKHLYGAKQVNEADNQKNVWDILAQSMSNEYSAN